MSDAIKSLTDDHRKVADLFKQVAGSANATLARKICQDLRIHATLEEELVYPILRRDVGDEITDEGEREHEEMEQLIAEVLEKPDMDPELPTLLAKLQQTVEHHVQEEETEAFPKLEAQTSEDLVELGNALFRRRQELMQEVAADA